MLCDLVETGQVYRRSCYWQCFTNFSISIGGMSAVLA